MVKVSKIARYILVGLIQSYRYTVSPILGNHCRFYPSCSCYAIDAVNNHGVFKGGYLTVKRLLCCHPWHPGGFDPIPKKHVKRV